jgi:hypothetical protein
MANDLRQILSTRETLPSDEELARFDTNALLALLHDAVGHLITPVHSLPKTIPILQQIAGTLARQQLLLEEVLKLRRDEELARFAARKLNSAPSLSYSVLKRDLHFLSVSNSYCLLFNLKRGQFRQTSLGDLVHPTDIPRFSRIVRILLSGKEVSGELVEWRVTGSGGFVLIKDTMWAIDTDQPGGPEYIVNVSERILPF